MAAPSRPATYVVLAVLTFIWGTTWAAIRIGLEGIPPLTGVALRFGIGGATLLLAGAFLRLPPSRSRYLKALWAVQTAFTFCLAYGVVYWAQQWVPTGLASILFATFPLFVAGFAHLWLPGEPLDRQALAGIALGLIGVAVIFAEDLAALAGHEVRLAALVLLISPLSAALANVLVKRWGKGIHPFSLTAVPMVLTGLIMGALAAGLERHRPVVLDGRSVGAVLYLALVGSALAFVLYFWLLEYLPATRLSLITYGIPVVAVLVGTVFLEEPFTWKIGTGAGLVILGVAVTVQRR